MWAHHSVDTVHVHLCSPFTVQTLTSDQPQDTEQQFEASSESNGFEYLYGIMPIFRCASTSREAPL